jgi:hypothetical protein
MLSQEIHEKKSMDLMVREFARNKKEVNEDITQLLHSSFMDNMYWSRKRGGHIL